MVDGTGGRGPVNLALYAKDLDFPATKYEIISHIREHPGPGTDDLIMFLKRLPDKQYNSLLEVIEEYDKID